MTTILNRQPLMMHIKWLGAAHKRRAWSSSIDTTCLSGDEGWVDDHHLEGPVQLRRYLQGFLLGTPDGSKLRT
jgi:hypothetical protein